MNNPKFICYNYWASIADCVVDYSWEQYKTYWGIIPLGKYAVCIPSKVDTNDIVFVKTDFINNGLFSNEILPHIKKSFYLITGSSDFSIDNNPFFQELIHNEKIIKWFCTNPPKQKYKKIIPLPIGFPEPCRPNANQNILNFWLNNHTPFVEKKDKFFLPFHNTTNPERLTLINYLKSLPNVVTQEKPTKDIHEYLKNMDQYKYILCLRGNGEDTHRFYESVLVGSIPIINSEIIKNLFDYWKLPGIFIDSWKNIDFSDRNRFKMNDELLLCERYKKKIMEMV